MPIELPIQVPCEICEGLDGRDDRYAVIDQGEHTLTVMNPWQYEIGQCIVVTRRHLGTLLDLSDDEAKATLVAAKRVAHALLTTFAPLGILVMQNNGVYSGQSVPHYHLHVIPRQPGSDWGIGPPQLAVFDDAGRKPGTTHDPSHDELRHRRAQMDAETLRSIAARIRANVTKLDSPRRTP
jgi:histidine triad (HIT) family protein